ncbi:MAG: hydrolase [Sedimentisphaerales bacterium]|nr:hydrolase [Sedimentisphaerales bacterium]
MLRIDDCCLVVVDVQGKLAQLMVDKTTLFENIRILIQAAKILDIPILWCQQVPNALGPTALEIAELLADAEPIDKACFSCWGAEPFRERLQATGRKQVLLCGIETHVCIYQTALDLLTQDYRPTVVADAVSSRSLENRQIALMRLTAEGIDIASTEMVLFELLQSAEHPQFKAIARLVK